MRYYSTNGKAPLADLRTAVVSGLAPDRGLYMPENIQRLPAEFFDNIQNLSFQEIAFEAAKAFFGGDVAEDELERIVYETLAFDCPVVHVDGDIWTLELFHGPTLAFKDVGARFMARLLRYFTEKDGKDGGPLNVLVATSGDTGSAVANGFLGVRGIRVFVLYPKGKVSPIQECQFTTLGQNITAVEIDGVFDDCQTLVKNAFMDRDLCSKMALTSANSINVARFLPQSFYYFYAYAQMKKAGKADNLVVCVPSGNFGNICSALFAQRMGLPVKRFIAANNSNDVFYKYIRTGKYEPAPSIQTLANAMDVGDPSNFARIMALYGSDWSAVKALVDSDRVSDAQIEAGIRECFDACGYVLDPHGACAYLALKRGLKEGETGVFCETAHPAKFKATVDRILNDGAERMPGGVEIPGRLAAFMKGEKKSVSLSRNYDEFKAFLLSKDTVTF